MKQNNEIIARDRTDQDTRLRENTKNKVKRQDLKRRPRYYNK